MTTAAGEAKAEEYKVLFMETSAKSGHNVKEVINYSLFTVYPPNNWDSYGTNDCPAEILRC